MMRKKISVITAMSLAAFLLGGCGTPMYALSEEEENLIVQYSAQILAKHNIAQKDGMTTALPVEEIQETESEETEAVKPEETDGSPEEGSSGDAPAETQTLETVSLEKAVGHEKDLAITYKGCKVQDIYKEGDYFAVTPDPGNKLVVFRFSVKNKSSKTVKLNTVSMENPFSASFGGGETVKETVSLGVESLSSYDGKIKPGTKKTVVLLFQIPEDEAKDISGEQLFVKLKDTNYSVKL